jgi:subtilisin family serine protease
MSKITRNIIVVVVALAMALPLFAAKPEKAEGRYFVGFRGAVTANDKAMLKSHGAALGHEFPEVNAVEIAVSNPKAVEALQNSPRVDYVEDVPMRYKLDLSTSQVVPSLSNGLYGLVTTKATTVHARNVTGSTINVGVADTQLDYTHPDIQANFKGGIDCVGGCKNGSSSWVNDGETHATHVAGTILGVNNSTGVYGVAYTANLYHARVLGPNGGSTSDIMAGVRWLVATKGCKIVNLSLGGGLKSRTEENFYNDMRKTYGAIVVAATGNDSKTTVSYPAGYAINVSVGAVDNVNAHASFSNTGKGIDVSAPGVMVLSSVPRGTGSESSVTTTASFTSHGMEFAPKTTGTSGILVNCGIGNPADFPTSVRGNIALIQRGTLSFADKVTNAKNAGAAAAIIYNNAAGDFTGTLGAAGSWIPAVSTSDTAGATLKAQAGQLATVVDKVSDWDYYDGTSMATPHTAGVVALIWSANPSLSADTVESYLKTTCVDLGAAGYDTTFGYGLVNADAAVAKAGK